MMAVRVHTPGGAEALRYEEVPTPLAGEREALVRIEAIGVNFTDVYHRTGLYKVPTPFIPGVEAAGIVEAVGPHATEVKPGDRVAYATQLGAYAEYAAVPSWKLVPVPSGMSAQVAAAVMLQGMTAHYLTHSTFPLKRGDRALVHAAAGGVGLLLVQIARRRGATVFGTVSTEEKARLAQDAGADHVIRYTEVDLEAEVKRLTEDAGLDVVYDSVGRDTYAKSLNSLRPRGMLVLFGNSSGPVPPIDPFVLSSKGSLFLTRPTLAHYMATREELLARAHDLFTWVASGELKVRVARTFPLNKAADAHRELEGRKLLGKALLIP